MTERIDTDVVVVGAGLGGLSAAGHLQAEGYDVVVLEHHTKPGGYAHNFKERGYRFEVALHALDGMEPGGWAYPMFEMLGVFETVEMNRLDPFYTVSFPDFEVGVTTEIPDYLAEICGVFPDERDGVADLFAALKRLGHDMARYSADRRNGVNVPMDQMIDRYPDMSIAFAMPWDAYVDQHIESREAKALLSTLWGYLGLPPSRVSAGQFGLTLLSYHSSGAWYPTGGSGAVTKAMAQTLIDRGAAIHYRNTVESITPVGPESVTVTTDRGLEVRARVAVSNASPRTTLGYLPDGVMDPSWAEEVGGETPALSSFVVYLGLDKDVAAEGWDYHEFFDVGGYDPDAEYEAIVAGDFGKAGMIISNYTVVDPGCAPEGGSVIVLTTLAPWDYRDVWGTSGDLDQYSDNQRYIETKETVADLLIDRAAERIPGLRESIVVRSVATPLTNVRYVMQPEGSLYGREQTVMSQMNRRKATTPVPNLFLAGSWVGGGGMTLAVGSGRAAAGAADRYLKSLSQ
ncbi:MAG: NAD(P)/FAD-dependent oxidoreductase [Actinomycetota bacterium]